MPGVTIEPLDEGANDRNDPDRLSLRQLAHELNSLLDGSLRYLELARRGASGNDAVIGDLDRAGDGLRLMADVMERAMCSPLPELFILRSNDTLGRTMERISTLLTPLAVQDGVTLECRVDDGVAECAAGLLESVIVNGLRNAIEAAASAPVGPRRVEATVSMEGDEVALCIADSGPGPAPDLAPGVSTRPGGHGVGFDLCERLVEQLGGHMRLVRAPYDRGTVLMITVPASALMSGSEAA